MMKLLLSSDTSEISVLKTICSNISISALDFQYLLLGSSWGGDAVLSETLLLI